MTTQENIFAEDQKDSDESPATEETELDRLYRRVPLIIARLRDDASDQELIISLKALLSLFQKINELEPQLLPPEERGKFQQLSLSRLYEMAAQNGGPDTEELKQANEAFAAENSILAQAIERLTFQINTLRRQAADEILQNTGGKGLSRKDINKALSGVAAVSSRIEKILENISPSGQSENGEGLDERFLRGLSGLDEISLDLLKASPSCTTVVGRLLRRFGFAYDYKDIEAIRKFAAAALKANRSLSDVSSFTTRIQELLSNVHSLVALIELHSGHEERQGVQYQEAMAQVDRLQQQVDRYEKEHGSLADLEKKIGDNQSVLKSTEKEISERRAALAEIKRWQGTFEAARPQPTQGETSGESANGEAVEIALLKAELASTKADSEKRIAALQDELSAQKMEKQQEILAADERMRMATDGLLVEKLEAEVQQLREVARAFEKQYEREREGSKALEERVTNWIQTGPELQKKINKWQKRAVLNGGFIAAAAAVTGFGGYELGSYIAAGIQGYGFYFVPPVAGMGVVGALLGLFGMEEKGNDIAYALKGLGIGVVIGAVAALLSLPGAAGLVNKDLEARQAKLSEEYQRFIKGDVATPFLISEKDSDGKRKVDVLSEKYEGRQVVFDFTNKDHPTFSIIGNIEKKPLEPQRPLSGEAAQLQAGQAAKATPAAK